MVIASAEIQGGHDLLCDFSVVANEFQKILKFVNYWCGDNNILEKLTMRYFREAIKRVNKKEDEHEDPQKSHV